MTALARGRCASCGKDVAVRRGWLAREHAPLPRSHAAMGSPRVCPGAGREVKLEYRKGQA
jgi:hypothetical protein